MAFHRRKWLGLIVLLCCTPSAFGSFKSRKIGPLEVEGDSLENKNHQDHRLARFLLQAPQVTNHSEWNPEEKNEWNPEKKEEWKPEEKKEEWKPEEKKEEWKPEEKKEEWKPEEKKEEWKPEEKKEEWKPEEKKKEWKPEEKKEEWKPEEKKEEWKPEEKKEEWKPEEKEELGSEKNTEWKVKDTSEEKKSYANSEETFDEEHKDALKQEENNEEWKPKLILDELKENWKHEKSDGWKSEEKHEEVVAEQLTKDWKSEEKKEVIAEERKEESKFGLNYPDVQVEDHKEEWKPEEKHEEVQAEEWKHDVPHEGWDDKSEELQTDQKLESTTEEGVVVQKVQENSPVVLREEKLELQSDEEESKTEGKTEPTSQESITQEHPGTNPLNNAEDLEQKQLEDHKNDLVTLKDNQEQLQHDQELKDREQLAKHIQDLNQEKSSQQEQELKDREQLAKHIQDLHQEKSSQQEQELKDREQLAKHIQDLHQEKSSQEQELKDREQLAKHIQDLHQERNPIDSNEEDLSLHHEQEYNLVDHNEEHLSLHHEQEFNLIDHNEEHSQIRHGKEESGNHAVQDDWTSWERNEVLRPTDKKMVWNHDKGEFVEVHESYYPDFEGGGDLGHEGHIVEDNKVIDTSNLNAEHDPEIFEGMYNGISQEDQTHFAVVEENKQVTEHVEKDSLKQKSAFDRNAGDQNPAIVSSMEADSAVLRGDVHGDTQSSEVFRSENVAASKDDPDHLVKKINVFSVQTKTHFVKVNEDLASTMMPFLGNKHAPAVASVISYCLLLLPLILILFVCEQVREFLTLQKAILFANIYLAVHFELLLVAALGLGSEPMEIFHEFSTSSYLVLQLVQAFGYILYLTLQTADLTLAYAEGTAIAKSTSTVQIVVAAVIGVHYYITVFLKATQGVAPTTSWKAYAFYSIAFMTLCLLGRIHRGKKQYHVGNETTDKKN